MKTQHFKSIGILALSITFLASCSKYEEGPIVSVRTKEARVDNSWIVAEAYDEGQDVSEDFDRYELDLDKDGDALLIANYYFNDIKVITETDGTWNFDETKEKLVMNFEDDDEDASYQILKLTEKEMWLRKEGDDLELHFEPK